MKYQILIILGTLTIATNCYSQIPSGTIAIGGDIGLSLDGDDVESFNEFVERKNRHFFIGPAADYFVKPNMALGFRVGYAHNYTESIGKDANEIITSNSESNLNVVSFGPTFRYFKMFTDNFGMFGQAEASIAFESGESEFSSGDNILSKITTKGNNFTAALTPGLIFFPSPRIGLEASFGSLSYFRYDRKRENESNQAENNSKGNDFELELGLNAVSFGVRYYIFKG